MKLLTSLFSIFMQTLQVELESVHNQLSNMSQLSDSLTKQMDNPTIVHLTAQETALRQRLFSMQQVYVT